MVSRNDCLSFKPFKPMNDWFDMEWILMELLSVQPILYIV